MSEPNTTEEQQQGPRKIPYQPDPLIPEKKTGPVLPPSLRNKRVVTIGSGEHAWEYSGTTWGLGWMRVLKPCLGYRGQPLNVGDLVQLPLNWMHAYLTEGQAEWIPGEKEREELSVVESARKFGYRIEVPDKPLRERPEFEHLQNPTKQKRSAWLDISK